MTPTRDEALAAVDGRHLRRERNRTAIIEAIISFYADGIADPPGAAVAERAGLSERSLFRYFDDLDDLCRSAFQLLFARAEPLVLITDFGTGSATGKIDAIVDQRIGLYTAMAPIMAIARAKAVSIPVVADIIDDGRAMSAHQLALHFDEELSALDAPARREAVGLIVVLLSFETWHTMTHHQRFDAATVRSALRHGVGAILGVEVPR